MRSPWPVTAAALLIFLSWSAAAAPPSKLVRVDHGRVPNEYLVVLQDDVLPEQVPAIARQLATDHNARVEKVWQHAVKGFFAVMPEARAEAMSRNPRVKYVEENAEWYLSVSHQTNIDPAVCNPTTGSCSTVTDNRLWHLDRLDQNYAGTNNSYGYCTNGTGVTVYVVDTGVNKHHQEFDNNRVQPGYNASGDLMPADDPCMGFAIEPSGSYDYLEDDFYAREILGAGHGTSVASALGGKRIGVAKNVTIVPIKTSRCDKDSARARVSSRFYQLNETMWRSTNGHSIDAIYRATNSGTTAASDPGSWPTTAGSTKVDGGVTWVVVDSAQWNNTQTTQMVTDGLNWILSASNSGPKSGAVVTLSTYRLATDSGVAGTGNTLEQAVRNLLSNGLTVIASANNQNGNACDTSPSRLSQNNPDTGVANNVITAGGTMLINRPWTVSVPSGENEADGPRPSGEEPWGTEPAYDSAKAVRDGRWICGPGDSSAICSNLTTTATVSPTSAGAYYGFQAGSNAGPCVTVFAPAKNIPVATPAASNTYRDPRIRGGHASGTSWSAPIVAGFAARILQNNPTYGPTQVRTALLANSVSTLDTATLNTRDHNGVEITGTPNKLLHLGDVKITAQPPATAVSGTTLTVTAAGTGTLSYQWYEANSGFDYTTYPKGSAWSSTAISGATSASYVTPSSTSTKAYWVRVSNSNACGTADSDLSVVGPNLGAPSNTNAIATGTSVTVTWNAGANAQKYEIQRKIANTAWTRAGLVNATDPRTFTETRPQSDHMIVYRVRSAAGPDDNNLVYSDPSNNDFANVMSSTYETIIVNVTTVKSQHLIDIRKATNALCAAVGAPDQYTAAELELLSLQGQTVMAAEFNSAMTRLNNIRQNALIGATAISFDPPEPASMGTILRAHMIKLRSGLE